MSDQMTMSTTPGRSMFGQFPRWSMPTINYEKLQQDTIENLRSESTGGGIKASLMIILLLVFISCCALCINNNYNFDKLFSSFNTNILFAVTSLTVIGMFLALAYGFRKIDKHYKGLGSNQTEVLSEQISPFHRGGDFLSSTINLSTLDN